MSRISWYIYKPLEWQRPMGYGVSKGKCRYAVPEGGRSVLFRQCRLKSVETVEGYGFCKRHAKVVRESLKKK